MQEGQTITIKTSNTLEEAFRSFDERMMQYIRDEEISRRRKNALIWYHRDVRVTHKGNGYFVVNLEGRCRMQTHIDGVFDRFANVKLRVYLSRRRGTVFPGKAFGVIQEDFFPRRKLLRK